ncbi:hypothetical protein M0804_009359 [Polistes exclamans]|nr:hypothetical protein M0804_009359 [Polistes exclamans]
MREFVALLSSKASLAQTSLKFVRSENNRPWVPVLGSVAPAGSPLSPPFFPITTTTSISTTSTSVTTTTITTTTSSSATTTILAS